MVSHGRRPEMQSVEVDGVCEIVPVAMNEFDSFIINGLIIIALSLIIYFYSSSITHLFCFGLFP